MEKIVLREMKLEEADEAGRVCKRAFNHVQVAQYGRMVSCRDEEKTCHALRELAARTKVPITRAQLSRTHAHSHVYDTHESRATRW
jgi:hypothetical protein